MIIQATKEINGVMYAYAYSDSGFIIERDGVRYSEAVDPIDTNRTYVETDKLIEVEKLSEGAAAEQDISGDEFLSMIEEVL